MDVAVHLHWFAHGQDPVVWLRVFRVLVFLAAAVFMWIEPMMCGGRNRFFHRLLSVHFVVAAFYSWGIAKARMLVLYTAPNALASTDLLLFDFAYTVMATTLLAKLVYDYFRFRACEQVKHQPHDCGRCDYTFTP